MDMKFTANRATFAAAVEYVASIAPTGGVLPILSNIRITAAGDEGGVHLAAFDYEVSARTTTPAGVIDGGDVLVSAAVLSRIVKGVSGDQLEFVVDDTQAVINCGGAEFTTPTMDVAGYPMLPGLDAPTCQIDAAALEAGVDRAGYAVSKDDAVPFLTGLLFDFTGDRPMVVGTDRYRLAVAELEVTQYYDTAPFTAIVPLRVLKTFLSGAQGPVEVAFSTPAGEEQPTMIGLSCAGRTSTARLLTGSYPKWQGILPSAGDAELTVTVDTDVLRKVLKHADAVLGDKPKAPSMLWLAVNPGQVRVTGGDESTFAQVVSAQVDGDGLMVKLQKGYLADVTKNTGAGALRFFLTTPMRPILVQPAGDPVDEQHLIMPVRA